MDIIEFFEHANCRNLKNTIKSKVHRRLQSISEVLDERRLMLRYLLEEGNLKYSKELALLARERIEKAAKDREEWFGIHRINREREIEKFLKLKQLQREMENCETWRHMQSKSLLLNTKQAQLYQIKEKESLREKDKEIQQMWHDVSQRYYEEKAKQHNLEVKLLKSISGLNQAVNLKNRECQDRRKEIARETAKAEFAME
ncbi:uncharacterized protein LOC101452887 [Ceratitis capitata]|uniref:uncharacterized protein LOC101452887 n=1 Tax=Ceratitis capitata TaxID=7213 RepID=UPI00061894EB|nr:uncharacterized protein LOC101452887 [Ceratitis capitata]